MRESSSRFVHFFLLIDQCQKELLMEVIEFLGWEGKRLSSSIQVYTAEGQDSC